MTVNQALPDRFWRKVDSGKIVNGELARLASKHGLPYGTVRNIVDGYQWKEVAL